LLDGITRAEFAIDFAQIQPLAQRAAVASIGRRSTAFGQDAVI